MLKKILNTILQQGCLCGLGVAALTLNLRVIGSATTFFENFCTFGVPGGVVGSFPGQKRKLDSSRQQPRDLFIQIQLIEFSMPYKGGVAESGGNGSII